MHLRGGGAATRVPPAFATRARRRTRVRPGDAHAGGPFGHLIVKDVNAAAPGDRDNCGRAEMILSLRVLTAEPSGEAERCLEAARLRWRSRRRCRCTTYPNTARGERREPRECKRLVGLDASVLRCEEKEDRVNLEHLESQQDVQRSLTHAERC